MLGLIYVLVIYVVVLGLHLVVPGRWVDGYVIDPRTNKPLRYHLNGLRVFFLTIAAWAGACWAGLLPWDAFYVRRWEMVISACALGLVFSAAIVFRAPPVKNVFADFYLGRLDNPQALGGRLDAKMWLYLIGAIMLALNLYSFAAAHYLLHQDDPSPGVFVSTALFTFFLVEYLNFEEVHLYSGSSSCRTRSAPCSRRPSMAARVRRAASRAKICSRSSRDLHAAAGCAGPRRR